MSSAMPLSMVRPGEEATVVGCQACDKLLHQLESLGLVKGSELRVVNEQCGNLIIDLKDSRLALSKGMANHLLVT